MATSSPKFVTMASLLAITMPEGQVHLAQVHHSVISVQTILLIQMFSVSLKLFILASAAADADAGGALHLDKDANSTKLASTQGPGVERESAPAARPVAEETLDSINRFKIWNAYVKEEISTTSVKFRLIFIKIGAKKTASTQ